MPFLTPRLPDSRGPELEDAGRNPFRAVLMGECANPKCSSGWLHLFRKRSRPVFEGGWTCSPECTEAQIRTALRRELDGRSSKPIDHRHRIPLGLLMLEKGWITHNQLRSALEAQRNCGTGRLGEWLVRQRAIDEKTVTRALGAQWSCPVLYPDSRGSGLFSSVIPKVFIDAFEALPLRTIGERTLYLGFENSLDPVLAFAIERMTGLRVENVIVPSSIFRPSLAGLLKGKFPFVQLAQAVSEVAAARLLARAVERAEPFQSRLVRVHDFLWLRMFFSCQTTGIEAGKAVRDVVCTIGSLQLV